MYAVQVDKLDSTLNVHYSVGLTHTRPIMVTREVEVELEELRIDMPAADPMDID